MTTCKCGKPFGEHEEREIDVCVAKALGHTLIRTIDRKYYFYEIDGVAIEIPHYSTDDSVAIKALMRPCIIVCGDNGYGILPADYLTNPPVKTVFIAEAKTVARALCYATLIEAAKGIGDE